MAAVCKVGSSFAGGPACALFASQPRLLADWIIQAIVEASKGPEDCHGPHFFGEVELDTGCVIDLAEPDSWEIAQVSLANVLRVDLLGEFAAGKAALYETEDAEASGMGVRTTFMRDA